MKLILGGIGHGPVFIIDTLNHMLPLTCPADEFTLLTEGFLCENVASKVQKRFLRTVRDP
jgi:hypothetical protein